MNEQLVVVGRKRERAQRASCLLMVSHLSY